MQVGAQSGEVKRSPIKEMALMLWLALRKKLLVCRGGRGSRHDGVCSDPNKMQVFTVVYVYLPCKAGMVSAI